MIGVPVGEWGRKSIQSKILPVEFWQTIVKSKVKETSSFYGRFIKIDSNLFRLVTLGEKESEWKRRKKTSSFAEFLGAGSNIPLKNGMTTVATTTTAAVAMAVAALAYTAALTRTVPTSDRNSNRMVEKMRESILLQLYLYIRFVQ